jgi:hypothetical protein
VLKRDEPQPKRLLAPALMPLAWSFAASCIGIECSTCAVVPPVSMPMKVLSPMSAILVLRVFKARAARYFISVRGLKSGIPEARPLCSSKQIGAISALEVGAVRADEVSKADRRRRLEASAWAGSSRMASASRRRFMANPRGFRGHSAAGAGYRNALLAADQFGEK